LRPLGQTPAFAAFASFSNAETSGEIWGVEKVFQVWVVNLFCTAPTFSFASPSVGRSKNPKDFSGGAGQHSPLHPRLDEPGTIEAIDASAPILAFTRTHESERAQCVFNMSAQTTAFEGVALAPFGFRTTKT